METTELKKTGPFRARHVGRALAFGAITATLLGAYPADATGTKDGGGGLLVRDSHNPWFLQNTTDASYCIAIDELNFGQTRARASEIIHTALDKWRAEFQLTLPAQVSGAELRVATQNFHETACSDSVDIRFQLGVLSEEQAKLIGRPQNYLGVTLRTDYDRLNLHGRGFVYISPSAGKLKPDDDSIVDDVWRKGDGALLYGVVLHELGHVFGLTHSSAGFDLMNERFPETIVAKTNVGAIDYLKKFPQPHVFGFSDAEDIGFGRGSCSAPPVPIPQHKEKVTLEPVSNQGKTVAEIFYGLSRPCYGSGFLKNVFTVNATDADGKTHVAGTANMSRVIICSLENRSGCEPSMLIWLPPQQKVFPNEQSRLVDGPKKEKETVYKGVYVTVDGKSKRPIAIVFSRALWDVKISGTIHGKTYIDIDSGY